MERTVTQLLKYIPGFRRLSRALRQHYERTSPNPFLTFAPPGHFHSPLPDMAFVDRNAALFDQRIDRVPGIDLHADEQLALARTFARYHAELPFSDDRQAGSRYWYRNNWFSYGDAIVLYSMIRHHRPRRVIEVGSGFTSAVMLDTNDRFCDGRLGLTFVEPHPERLLSLLSDQDKTRHEILVTGVQTLPLERFAALEANDILFIDSSHVAKFGSDVAHLLTHVLPSLQKGVIVHFHDIFWPFEYPEDWIRHGRAWNESYMLQAFLQFNTTFAIRFFNSYLGVHHADAMGQALPLFMKGPGGSLWIEKTA
jgi:predicted O-methyltransferase YrrM